ncbi:MAG: hypothetical protein HYU57_05035 [Micavibrio aeruginosavorus]|nr:hypothetical protein [Micavibrio aeruginosavorus]
MGSLASRPKVPAVQTVYMPVYTPPPPSSAPPETGPEDSAAAPPAGDQAAARRSESLLDRRRGVLSTVLTGFRGLLNQTTAATPRKTLLGE